MAEPPSDQIGSTLHRLVAELIDQRRRLALLLRENRELREQIEALTRESPDSGDGELR